MAIIGETRPVTEVTIQPSDGINGTINNPTTTPEIVLSLGDITPDSVSAVGTVSGSNLSGTNTGDDKTNVTGILKGNGTDISAATPSVDYVVPSDLTNYETKSDYKKAFLFGGM